MSEGLKINAEVGLCTKDMAKENPIKDFEILIEEHKDKWSKQMYDYFKECLSIIKKELKKLEEIDYILKDSGLTFDDLQKVCFAYTVLTMRGVNKKLKALEIIKEKNVAITMIKQTNSIFEYNLFAGEFTQIKRIDKDKYKLSPQPLTEEEYDLLKEVLL